MFDVVFGLFKLPGLVLFWVCFGCLGVTVGLFLRLVIVVDFWVFLRGICTFWFGFTFALLLVCFAFV